jgi:hypothetical protein
MGRLSNTGLGQRAPPSLGTFDLDLHYDDSYLTFVGAEFGDTVLGDQLDLSGSGSNPYGASISTAGAVNLFELSLDSADDLNAGQADSFTLATLTFAALRTTSSQLSLTINALGDSHGNPLEAAVGSATVSTVPLPSALVLFAPAVAGLPMAVRKRKPCRRQGPRASNPAVSGASREANRSSPRSFPEPGSRNAGAD